ncbi:MAG: ABC transporter ATP-binding protein [Anaerolineales bacterium]|nr:ABC transporter ATP-binding protein [Anaerolineales bacterium]MCB9128144.1 ABC transporter ATP-binding protein [Ardenticatenales bacterium]MCB9171854.1 ABC transporter ATP-binding protein [Ardenticatenales bacterium]
MASVTYNNIYKSWGEVKVIKDLNLEIRDKEFLVLVGPSGSGKSTALRLLAGLEEITSGELYIGDRLVNDVPPKDRDIAMVFQSYALYPHMSVYDNMAFGLKLRKMPAAEIEEKVKEAAGMLGLETLLDRKPKALSGGQRQRVALGRAIVRHPAVFLMDEPLSNLDAKLRVETRSQISKLHKRLDTTFVYVTHDQTEALTMADRIAVLKDGMLQQVDSPQVLYDSPKNVFVAGFIGSPAMNFFDATVTGSPEEMYIDTGGFRVRVPQSYVNALRGYGGKKVVFGIRPEDIHSARFTPGGVTGETVRGKVDMQEIMGNEIILYMDTSGSSYTARVDPRERAQIGDEVEVAFNMENMHVFDPETEEAIYA